MKAMFYGFSSQGGFAVRYFKIFWFTFDQKEEKSRFFFFPQLGSVSYRFYFHSFLGRLLGGQAVPQHLLGQFPNNCRTWRDSSAG